MAKDPAFLFYPNDYLGGTMGMSFEMKGAYIDLLIFQFNNHHFTEAQAQQVLSICFTRVWDMLKSKFKNEGENGEFYYNERLRIEVEKRKAFTESRKINALQRGKHKKAYAQHMGNENENRNKDRKKKEKTSHIPPSIEDVTAYCKERNKGVDPQVWYDHYQAKGWMIGKSKMVNWQAAVRTWEKSNGTDPKRPKFGLSPDAAKRIEEIERENAAKQNRA
jgi:hypothetical protein